MNLKGLIRPHLLEIEPYSSARDEYTGREGVFLDANENPNDSEGSWNRYPDPYQRELKSIISELKGVKIENTFIGLGSDEPIDLLIRAFCEPGQDEIMIFPPTYGMYKVSAGIHNVGVTQVLLKENFQLDVEAAISKLSSNTKIVFVCSPNNPTGNKIDRGDIEALLEKAPGLVVIDEAYIDFHDEPSWARSLKQYDNLIVLQTLSKAWGLASIRLGLAYAHEDIIQVLNKIKPPYNIPGPVQQLASKALKENAAKMKNEVSEILSERARLVQLLTSAPQVQEVIPSDTNFLLVRFSDHQEIFKYLMEQKVIVRDRSSQPLCEGCLRLTVGKREENDRLISVLTKYPS